MWTSLNFKGIYVQVSLESLSYLVLLSSFYIKLGKEKGSNNSKMDKYTGVASGCFLDIPYETQL